MCLILIKKDKTKMTDAFFDIAKKAWRSNSHGSSLGVIRNRCQSVIIKRGLMTEKEMITAIENSVIRDEDIAVLHLRIATQGSSCKENTHGFMASLMPENSALRDRMEGTFWDTTHVFHNGGFSSTIAKPQTNDEADYSDTKLITKNLFSKPSGSTTFADQLYEFRRKCASDTAFTNIVGSSFPALSGQKLAFLNADKGLLTLGTFYEDSNGFLHSHNGYTK